MCLVALLIAVYFLTFSGYAISRDEWFLFDATESIARHGTMELNYEFDAYPPQTLDEVRPPSVDAEPLQPVLAAPLFLAAQALPGIGLAHTVWLFNILVTALTAGVLYAYGLARGYPTPTAAGVALMFGLGTIAWPYSRTFFREPLFTLLGLLSAYLVLRVRLHLAAGDRPWGWLVALAVVLAGALLAKEVALLLLPALVIEALPSRLELIRLTRRRFLGVLLGVLILSAALIIVWYLVDRLFDLPQRYEIVRRWQQANENLSELSVGVRGYLFSPGRSLWLFSPVLLSGFAAWPYLIRRRRWRELLLTLAVVVMFVVGYAAVRGPDRWTGGLGWGSRYLVPVTPFLALWLLPVVQGVIEPSAARWKRIAVAPVCMLSAAIQIAAVWVHIDRGYYATLEAEGIAARDAVWNIRWSPIPVTFDLINEVDPDLVWQYVIGTAWLLPALCLLQAGIALGWALWWWHRGVESRRALLLTAASLLISTVLVLGGGLIAIREDTRYWGNFRPARDLLDAFEPRLEPDDVIVLNDFTYSEFFMNYYKRREPEVYTLPQSPGERSSPELEPVIESANPEVLIHPSNTLVLADLAQRHDRLWLVINSSAFIPWSVRPVEHYLARHYFPVSEVGSSDLARAILFDMTPAPAPIGTEWPALSSGATFGESLRLVGLDIPGGTVRPLGDVLPVSLLWETVAPVPQDYTVALFVVSADGTLVAQRDSYPVNSFEPTQSWRPGALHRDNHGLQLPDDLPPGTYELWAAVYWWPEPDQRLPVTGPAGAALGDHVILTTIAVR
ncbi:MAG: hypothetical protein EHM39_01365 [Chloroflexi bacterium]|nr:MAG: hypothetical protein EHM39_01365 [Chloroflexota bacterium]